MTSIITQFGFNTTASEVAQGINLSGKRIIVTGAASGIGIETARASHEQVRKLRLACATQIPGGKLLPIFQRRPEIVI